MPGRNDFTVALIMRQEGTATTKKSPRIKNFKMQKKAIAVKRQHKKLIRQHAGYLCVGVCQCCALLALPIRHSYLPELGLLLIMIT